ncbi:SdpI family protein [Candidatus Falkowbacteria bacterium]|nr:SdpI family protein [Candidatus Falkowbacteria bacterium]
MKSPIKLSIKTEILPILLIIISFALAFYFYAHFPERVAGHWNFNGQVDRSTSKTTGAFAVPFVLLGMYILFLVLPFFDPRKERYVEFSKTYHLIKLLIIGVLFIVYLATGLFNLGYPININLVVPWIIGLLMIILGNYMGKIKFNWFVGIKTPWTLSSENVWNKTHRVGGWFFIIFGLIIIITPLLPELLGLIAFSGGVALAVIGTFVYSYIAFKKEIKK